MESTMEKFKSSHDDFISLYNQSEEDISLFYIYSNTANGIWLDIDTHTYKSK